MFNLFNRFLLLLAIFFCSPLFSQDLPFGIPYQAQFTNSDGSVVSNKQIALKFEIRSETIDGSVIFEELHEIKTNKYGQVSLILDEKGETLPKINWGQVSFFMNVKVDLNGGSTFIDFGTSEIMNQPIAYYAQRAGNTFSGDFNDLINVPSIDDNDTNSKNELQSLSTSSSGDTLFISKGNYIIIPGLSSLNQ